MFDADEHTGTRDRIREHREDHENELATEREHADAAIERLESENGDLREEQTRLRADLNQADADKLELHGIIRTWEAAHAAARLTIEAMRREYDELDARLQESTRISLALSAAQSQRIEELEAAVKRRSES